MPLVSRIIGRWFVWPLIFVLAGCTATPTELPVGAKKAAPIARVSFVDTFWNFPDRVFFAVDRCDLDADARQALSRWIACLKHYPNNDMTLEGHADERGTREYNLALGLRRAESVKAYLIASGIEPARLKTISYGKERPAVLGANETAWAQNRRVVGDAPWCNPD